MSKFDYRFMVMGSTLVVFVLTIVLFGIALSGCAVSGCGNPIIHNDVDSNDYINDQSSVMVNVPEREPLHPRRADKYEKIKGKYSRRF